MTKAKIHLIDGRLFDIFTNGEGELIGCFSKNGFITSVVLYDADIKILSQALIQYLKNGDKC